MFRHVILLRFTADATAAQKQSVKDQLEQLPAEIPEIRAYTVGPDAGVAAGNWDFAIVADFDDREGFLVYGPHPEHQRVLGEHIRPVLADRAAVQFEVG